MRVKWLWKASLALIGTALGTGLLTTVTPIAATGPGDAPGERAGAAAVTATSGLTPVLNKIGKVYMSNDGFASDDPAGGSILVDKHGAGTTVQRALLVAASSGFSGYTPVGGDVTLAGMPVTWDPGKTMVNGVGSVNVLADVTAIVKPIVDGAPPGNVSLTVAEPTHPTSIDGEILAVVLNDPSLPSSNTVRFLYGALPLAGDTFSISLADPVDTTDPDFGVSMSLGLSFGYQADRVTGQVTQIDVNGTRITTSAGGNDDSRCKATGDFAACLNGQTVTVGGVGDSMANPADPNATDANCGPVPTRCDDELYDLLPFVADGDTSISVAMRNQSQDDNILFSAVQLNSATATGGSDAIVKINRKGGPACADRRRGVRVALIVSPASASVADVSDPVMRLTRIERVKNGYLVHLKADSSTIQPHTTRVTVRTASGESVFLLPIPAYTCR